MATTEANEPSRTIVSHWQRAEMGSHIAHAAARCESNPFLTRGYLETLFTVIGVVQASNCLTVFFNHFSRVELRIDHDSVRRGMSEKSLDYVHRNVIVEMLGS